jgi:hypothetical protein
MADLATGAIFINYRREETAYPAGWLFNRLAETYGEDLIFKDVDSIELGDDFVDVITRAVASTDVLLALIGGNWISVTDEAGRRRLDDPDDFVRLEIEAALTRGIRVIPILVGGAAMPRRDQLPPSLAALARRHALELSPSRFDFDTNRLITVLDKTLADVREETLAGAIKGNESTDREQRTAPRSLDEPGSFTSSPSRKEPSSRKHQEHPQISGKRGDHKRTGVPGTHWRGRVVAHWRLLTGIVAMSLLVLALIAFVATRSSSSSNPPTSVTTPPTEIDQDLISASSSSVLPPYGEITYSAKNTLDQDTSTAWNAEDDGIGESLRYEFARPVRLTRLELINGFAVDSKTFAGNARLREVTFITDDQLVRHQLKDSIDWQTVHGAFGVTTALTIKINSVYAGNRPDWNDAALTEIRFWGVTT